MDYDSFMTCHNVCKDWNEVLSTESYQQIAKKLLKEKKVNEEKLCEASSKGDVEEIKHLLSIEVNPNCSKARGTKGTPLYYAALYRNKDVVQLLMKAGADPNKLNATGESPLLYAAYRSYPDLVKLLIENGADPKKAESAKIRTPLYWAVKDGSIDLTKLLLGAGAEVNRKDNGGKTPIHYAAGNGNQNMVKLLLDAGADPNMKDFWRQTPLSMAKDLSGKNPIHMPDIWTPELIENSTAVVKLLLDAGADEKESWACITLHCSLYLV